VGATCKNWVLIFRHKVASQLGEIQHAPYRSLRSTGVSEIRQFDNMSISCAQAWRRTAQSVEALALSMQREVPDTAATMRLSGLELADAIGEVTLLGADLTEASRRSED